MPTIIQIEGLEPINNALEQASTVIDKVNISIGKLIQTPHMIGIMILGLCISGWGMYRLQKTDPSMPWQHKMVNGLILASGVALTITAPIISARIHRLTL